MDITIWHNPSCSTSRGVLAMIEEAGFQPRVVEYLTSPPTRAELAATIRDAGIGVRDAIRSKEPLYAELGLANPAAGDDALLDAMVAHPRLIERPFVITPAGTRLCRPRERVYEILPG